MRASLVAAAVIFLTTTAHADGLDGQRFVPAAGAAGGFVVERVVVPKHLGWGLGAFAAYGHRPVVVLDRARDTVVARPLASALSLDVLGSIGLGNFFELAVHVPLRPVWSGDEVTANGQPLRARGGLGDLRVMPKFQILDRGSETFHVSIGAAVPVTFPTGNGLALRGHDAVSFEPKLMFGIGGAKWDFLINGGYLARPGASTNLAGKSEITFGGAFTYRVHEKVDLQLEVYGAHLPDARTTGSKTPLESLLGVIIWPSNELSIYAGAGPGLTSGVGSPDFRAVLGVRFGHRVPGRDRFGDSDGDGIDNAHDKCPDEAEDKDGFEDEDGCPDPDNDKDGILDEKDECPETAEEVGGDGDGCPDKGRVVYENGHFIVIGKVQFDSGSAHIAKQSDPLVDDVAKVMKGNPDMKIRIEGHTDNTGPKEVNEKLSKDRAESVKAALIKRGIPAERLETVGHGPNKPMSTNDSAVGRARNRRVEFNVTQ